MNTMVSVEPRNTLTELEMRLSAAPFDGSDIRIFLKDGVLRLTGVVSDRATKRDAKALLRSINGISQIEDDLQIAGETMPPQQITTSQVVPHWWPMVGRLRSKIH